MVQILVTESTPQTKKFFDRLEKEGHKVFYIDDAPNEDEILAHNIDILSVFINTRVSSKVIEGLPNLKLIISRSTGVDHIDIKTAAKHNVAVANVPGYGAIPVAEFTFGILLCLLRKIVKADQSLRAGLWSPLKFQGLNICGKTFGVIGTGAIGTNVCRIAKAFGANVIAYDVVKKEDVAKEIGFLYVDLEDLIRESDIISLHIPLSKETYHLINSETISKMKDGVIIVNTARGPIIDYKALIEALKSGKIAGAALDVYEQEPPPYEYELYNLENTVLTPHIAWNTLEAEEHILDITINTIREFIAGRKPKNIIT